MIALVKLVLLVLLFMFLIAVFRIGYGVFKFLRLVKRAGNATSGQGKANVRSEKTGKRRPAGDGRTIELDKDDYKVE